MDSETDMVRQIRALDSDMQTLVYENYNKFISATGDSWMSEWVKSLSRVRLFATPWTVAYHAPPSMEFSRQEYWSGLPFPSPEDLPETGTQILTVPHAPVPSALGKPAEGLDRADPDYGPALMRIHSHLSLRAFVVW